MTIVLYKKDSKGKIREWKGYVEGNEVVTFTGLLDGKKKEERREAKPKNVGRANETTAEEQAELELVSKANKERDKGYFDTVEEAESNVVALPMLAHPFDKRKQHIVYPALVQPKLDGVRCMAHLKDGKATIFSRKGKALAAMPNLLASLTAMAKKLDRELYLDGELFSHEIPFEELVGHCRRSMESHEKKGTTAALDLICLNVFDCYHPKAPEAGFQQRYDLAKKVVGGPVAEGGYVQMVANTPVADEADVKNCHSQFIAEGHEGTIIRNIHGVYALNARSNDLLKYKDFLDDEFEIVGFVSGEGRDKGTVIWTCKTKDGSEFNVRPRGTWQERANWLTDAADFIGKHLTVRYQELTQDGIPRFPVGIVVRDYE